MKFRYLCTACLGISVLASCVDVDRRVGQNYLGKNQQYEIYTAEFPIDDIRMDYPEELSSYSNYRFTVGAINDDLFGVTTRSSTFTLVPISKKLDFGKPGTQVFKSFHFSAPIDTLSYAEENQRHIFQNINVYEVEEYVDITKSTPEVKHGTKRITQNVPVYNGADSLSFYFTEEFAKKYMEIAKEDLDSLNHYSKKFPGIYLTTDAPKQKGGRINMFKLPLDVANGYIFGSVAVLKFRAEYDKGPVDTSFYFSLGPLDMYDFSEVTSTSVEDQPQVAYNLSSSESSSLKGQAAENYWFEGGKGLKPVISAASLREKIVDEVSKHGNPSEIVISKASLRLPFIFPENYMDMIYYPTTLSPTCRIESKDGKVTFANLTDSSVSSENQGEVNRSICVYAPDITHHTQEIISLKDESKISNYDIWFLAVATENTTTAASEAEAENSYNNTMNQLAFSQYYNNLYYGDYGGYGGYGYGYGGYGYGSYGGYGGYGSNYYYYAMMQSMAASSYSGKKSASMLDLHRFYKAEFVGPAASKNVPTLSITYAVPVKN